MKLLPKKNMSVGLTLMVMLVLVTAVVYAANVTIDDFSLQTQDSTSVWTTGDALPRPIVCTYTNPTSPNTIGGHRDVCIQIGNASTSGDQARLRVTTNQLALSSDSSLSITGTVQWDGADATSTLDPTGLGTQDLTDSATNDGILVRIINSDGVAVRITLRIFTDGSNWAEQSINLATQVTSPNEVVDLFFPFSGFSGGAGTMNEASVGAVEAEIVSLSPGPDLNIDLIEATSTWDFGDLPAPYLTTLAANGARHRTTTGLRLGSSVDTEIDGVPNASAMGDDTAFVIATTDDEDGVVRQPSFIGGSTNGGWTNGTVATLNGGALDITIAGGNGTPQVFVDFGSGLTEVILRDLFGNALSMPLSAGTTRVYFDIPNGTFDGINPISIPVRVRLSSAGGLTANGPANDGEVEDYIFNYGPTAVSLQDTSATSTSSTAVLVIASLFATALLGVSYISYRKRQI